jgi:hypothetical protein
MLFTELHKPAVKTSLTYCLQRIEHHSRFRFAQMKWNILKHFQYSRRYVTCMVHINCGSPADALPGANKATPLGKLKTTTFFIYQYRARARQERGWDGTSHHAERNALIWQTYTLSNCYRPSSRLVIHKLWLVSPRHFSGNWT